MHVLFQVLSRSCGWHHGAIAVYNDSSRSSQDGNSGPGRLEVWMLEESRNGFQLAVTTKSALLNCR
jgi:hypothetical protein